MDAIVLLREDHKTVEKLFKRFEKTSDDDTAERRRIADEVIEELTVHAWIEEKFFAREPHPTRRTTSWRASAMGRNRLTELGGELEAGKKQAPRDPLAVPSSDSK
ncbi:hypothetical protein ACFZBM_01775 [Streptomyces lavendulae]|uniref:Uncharacterized protein n=1 Tax=Streptomyces lavendulae subsp. lavendulae TaxID=58340 RepID=A0A2K8P8W0_STRLA|nr:hypothetical protein [Streptomyces lavendulae]ATZ23181.1 hypothetical protein SLAV_06380 [Streptomyces lavendulae subsp. lavendulae]QUQ53017.1 hypothetical protein SLLC_04400 [Streptomyces lavendulae subsp. lavendulae]